jgi:hypothetical protein
MHGGNKFTFLIISKINYYVKINKNISLFYFYFLF